MQETVLFHTPKPGRGLGHLVFGAVDVKYLRRRFGNSFDYIRISDPVEDYPFTDGTNEDASKAIRGCVINNRNFVVHVPWVTYEQAQQLVDHDLGGIRQTSIPEITWFTVTDAVYVSEASDE